VRSKSDDKGVFKGQATSAGTGNAGIPRRVSTSMGGALLMVGGRVWESGEENSVSYLLFSEMWRLEAELRSSEEGRTTQK